MNLYNHHHPATKNNLLSTPNLKLMVLLLALTTGVVGAVPIPRFSPMYLMEVIHSSGTSFGWKRKSGYN
ncbi:hypothetical protein [Turicibacter bilis]|uniref:hypothetical protein n=1 Tax=Turicibacter bilis TaxID=2735723 RepID=UPI001BAEE6D8|nr:hypothetical protein [Turicibacter bilis]MBS3197056.1 hypothetical protein [Turicibacter bilis]